jgi:hypothetical protein
MPKRSASRNAAAFFGCLPPGMVALLTKCRLSRQSTPHRPPERSLYLDDYFSERYRRGDRPDYSVSMSGLPEVPAGASMEVEVGFLVARQRGRG